jgi:hypothetical protein
LPFVRLIPAALFCHLRFNLCSLFNRQTNLQRIQNVQEWKRHKKKEKSIATFIFVPSVFGENFPTAEF